MFEPHLWRIARMAVRRVFRQCHSPEDTELDHWLDLDAGGREMLQEYPDPDALIRDAIDYGETDIASAWEQLTDMDPSLKVVPKHPPLPDVQGEEILPRLPWYQRWRVAALLFLFIGGAVFCFALLFKNKSKRDIPMTIAPPPLISDTANALAGIQPGGYKLFVILPGHDTIKASVLSKKDTAIYKHVIVHREGEGTLLFKPFPPPGRRIAELGLVTPMGGWYNIVLPDRSKVCMNAGSVIRFNTAFGRGRDTLTIQGEVYLQTPQKQRPALEPLHIRFDGRSGFILDIFPGSECNISAYPDDSLIRTTVVKGLVLVKDSTGSLSVELKPGIQHTLAGGTGTLDPTIDTVEAVAWKNGRFIFRGRPIQGIMRQIGRWYDTRVECHDPPKRRFTLNALRSQPLRDVLDLLGTSEHVHFDVGPGRIIVTQ